LRQGYREIEMISPIPLQITPGPELLIILLVLVLLFGANKIPKLARSTGQAMGEFKKGREEIEDELSDMTDPEASPSETANEPTEETDETETETEKAS